jgi:hypothetical protein
MQHSAINNTSSQSIQTVIVMRKKVIKIMLILLKYENDATCFDHIRSSSGIFLYKGSNALRTNLINVQNLNSY